MAILKIGRASMLAHLIQVAIDLKSLVFAFNNALPLTLLLSAQDYV